MGKQKELSIPELLALRAFDANQAPPHEEVVFRIAFKTIGSLGDYILITGRPKSGKTKYLSGIMAAGLSRSETLGMSIKLPDHKRRVVHFDTEQGKRSHFNTLDLAKRLTITEMLPDWFMSYHCRQDSPAQIIAMIEYYLQVNPDTGMIVLDGLLDCVESFNDEKHSKALVNWLKRITEVYNVLLVGVIHRSISADKSIGHLGSSADRAAQSVLVVEKDKERKQYVLKGEYLRDCDEFPPVAIRYDSASEMWVTDDYTPEPVKLPRASASPMKPWDIDLMQHLVYIGQVFTAGKLLSYEELRQSIREVYGVTKIWSVECIKYLVKEGQIFRTENGYTNIKQARLMIEK